MSFATEFADFPADDMPVLPESFQDTSWRNDVCPSFTSDLLGLTIWINYACEDQREFAGSKRFLATPQQGGVEVSGQSIETDAWEDILEFCISRAQEAIESESCGACSAVRLDALNSALEHLFSLRG